MDEKINGVIGAAIAEFGEQTNLASREARERITERIVEKLEESGFLIAPAASSGPFLRKRPMPSCSIRSPHLRSPHRGLGTGG